MGPVLGLGPQGGLVLRHLGGLRRATCTPAPPAGWDGRRAAYLAIAGFVCVLFNFGVVNIFFSGEHSYAGIG